MTFNLVGMHYACSLILNLCEYKSLC